MSGASSPKNCEGEKVMTTEFVWLRTKGFAIGCSRPKRLTPVRPLRRAQAWLGAASNSYAAPRVLVGQLLPCNNFAAGH